MTDQPLPCRHSIRLKGYDYSKAGFYFITLCVQDRLHLFGKCLQLNDAGEMVGRWYFEMQNKYPNIRCHEMVVMPNHFHCIIEITPDTHITDTPVSDANVSDANVTDAHVTDTDITDAHVTDTHITDTHITDAHAGAPLRGRPNTTPVPESINNTYGPNNKKYNATIGDMMDWFKTMTTNEYIRGVKNHGWQRFNGKLWQRNYWEHIIRDEASLARIANYIVTNPDNWDKDQLYR